MDIQPQNQKGIFFSKQFCIKLQQLWQELGKDSPSSIADIQKAKQQPKDISSEQFWAIHFVPREIVAAKDILIVEGFQIHISAQDRRILRGKVLDFQDDFLVVVKPINKA